MSNLEPTEWTLADNVLAIVRSQLSFFFTGLSADDYLYWRAELQKQGK